MYSVYVDTTYAIPRLFWRDARLRPVCPVCSYPVTDKVTLNCRGCDLETHTPCGRLSPEHHQNFICHACFNAD